MDQIKQLINELKTPRYYATLVLCGATLILLVIVSILSMSVYGLYTKDTSLITEIETAKRTLELIRNNQEKVIGNIDQYNETLEKLIPDEESYFSVISALDQLSVETGVDVVSYSIDLDSTTEEKLTLDVVLNADTDSLETFIKEYKYKGGRFITNEKTIINNETLSESLTFSLNFYHKKFDASGVDANFTIEDSDLRLLDSVMSQTGEL